MLQKETEIRAVPAGVRNACDTRNDNQLMTPEQAAVEMQPDLKQIARMLCPGDVHLQLDATQESALGILLTKGSRTRAQFRGIAFWRARSFLTRWRHPDAGPLDYANA